MKTKKIFWVDIPKAPNSQIDKGEWENIATFDTRKEAVEFIQEWIDSSCTEEGIISTLIIEGEEEVEDE